MPRETPRLTPAQKDAVLEGIKRNEAALRAPRQRSARIRASNNLLLWLQDYSPTIGPDNAMQIMNLANAVLKGQAFTVTPVQA